MLSKTVCARRQRFPEINQPVMLLHQGERKLLFNLEMRVQPYATSLECPSKTYLRWELAVVQRAKDCFLKKKLAHTTPLAEDWMNPLMDSLNSTWCHHFQPPFLRFLVDTLVHHQVTDIKISFKCFKSSKPCCRRYWMAKKSLKNDKILLSLTLQNCNLKWRSQLCVLRLVQVAKESGSGLLLELCRLVCFDIGLFHKPDPCWRVLISNGKGL